MAASSSNAWCAAGALCATGPMNDATLLAGDAALCPHDAWASSSGCVTQPFPDPVYETNAWAFDLINIRPVWEAGYTGAGVTINIVDDGPDETHADFASKYDPSASCPGSTSSRGDHGTTTAAIALAASNGQCSRGVAYGATLSKCPLNAAVQSQLIFSLSRNMVSSNSWGIDPCVALANSGRRKLRQRRLQSCPFATSPASANTVSPLQRPVPNDLQ